MEGDELLRLILQLAVCPLFPMVQAVRQPDNSRWLSHAFTFISNPGKLASRRRTRNILHYDFWFVNPEYRFLVLEIKGV